MRRLDWVAYWLFCFTAFLAVVVFKITPVSVAIAVIGATVFTVFLYRRKGDPSKSLEKAFGCLWLPILISLIFGLASYFNNVEIHRKQSEAQHKAIQKEKQQRTEAELREKKDREKRRAEQVKKKERAEKVHMESALHTFVSPLVSKRVVGTPYRRGKIIVVILRKSDASLDADYNISDLEKRSLIDGLVYETREYENSGNNFGIFAALPSSIRTTNAAEAGTIACIHWERFKVGEYIVKGDKHSSGSADRIRCTLTVVDKPLRTVIVRRRFLGSNPPQQTRTSMGMIPYDTGSWPAAEVAAYLEKLPRK